jgi:hypothetical protein
MRLGDEMRGVGMMKQTRWRSASVIARSQATKQSSSLLWIASLRSQ